MLYGVEADITDFEGNLSMEQWMLDKMDIGIASFHETVCLAGSREENTRAFLQAMQTPGVSIIGHPDDGRIPLDYEALVLEAKRTGVLIEVNNSSLDPTHHRQNTWENYRILLKLCERHGAMVVLGSDAHFAPAVGSFDLALALLEEMKFPEVLVINTDPERFKEMLRKRK
jgi:putative hydrolase